MAKLKFLVLCDRKEDANKELIALKNKFPYDIKFHAQLDRLIHSQRAIRRWGCDYVFNEQTTIENINLSTTIPEDVINELRLISNEFYFVGSSVHSLINKEKLNSQQDIDIVMLAEEEVLLKSGYKKAAFIPNLYTKKLYLNQTWVFLDCYVPFKPSDNIALIENNFFLRDFTVNALFCDDSGHLHDPTGTGLSDFKDHILRTIKPAVISFHEDPTRILRAIKRVALNSKPTHEIELALTSWTQPLRTFHPFHVYAVTRKLLKTQSISASQIIQFLKKYNLLEKLFDIEEKQCSELQLLQLLKEKISFDNKSQCLPFNEIGLSSTENTQMSSVMSDIKPLSSTSIEQYSTFTEQYSSISHELYDNVTFNNLPPLPPLIPLHQYQTNQPQCFATNMGMPYSVVSNPGMMMPYYAFPNQSPSMSHTGFNNPAMNMPPLIPLNQYQNNQPQCFAINMGMPYSIVSNPSMSVPPPLTFNARPEIVTKDYSQPIHKPTLQDIINNIYPERMQAPIYKGSFFNENAQKSKYEETLSSLPSRTYD